MATHREIIKIDEEKCDGCGLCVPACAEGAIQIIDGKARLVSETYCDGLGACLGECPQGAITMEVREAGEFDKAAVAQHLQRTSRGDGRHRLAAREKPIVGGCPGAAAQMLCLGSAGAAWPATHAEAGPSELSNWPVQINLMPIEAPYLDGARLLIAADCVPFAYPGFHRELLRGRILLIGCPKLDDVEHYREKLADIFRRNDIRSVEVAYMEVPCCFGMVHLVQKALADSGKGIPLSLTKIGIRGEVQASDAVAV